jgi:fatty-acyl-CoA synthase
LLGRRSGGTDDDFVVSARGWSAVVAWHFGDLWEIAAESVPTAPALAQGERTVSWADFDRHANALARSLVEAGAKHDDKVAIYLYNSPEYLETCFACFKAALVPVNTNYRYADSELVYLWDNADAVAVVFHGAFVEHVEHVRERVPKVHTWLWVDDGTGPCPSWAASYESTIAEGDAERLVPPWGRGDDDLLMIYTGGTTGQPKGVMWRHDDVVRGIIGASAERFRGPADYDVIRASITRPGRVTLPACPLMHATGFFASVGRLTTAGSVVFLEGRRFDAEELLQTVERRTVNTAAIVGDAIAKPILAALDANPGRWDLSSLQALTSSGVMWSAPVKEALLRHLPQLRLIDNFGSSEAMGMGQSVSTSADTLQTAKFTITENTRVIDDENREVEPGSGQVGRVAVRGHQPVGYYKDQDKSDRTFVVINGERYSIPGDYARVEADGTLALLGRGSVCINTGGEKVFPEEVEEVLKLHGSIKDAVVVGVPDDRFGEVIAAVVEARPQQSLDAAELVAHVKEHLASYKAPKLVVPIATIGRAANGKVDYEFLRDYAAHQLALAGG